MSAKTCSHSIRPRCVQPSMRDARSRRNLTRGRVPHPARAIFHPGLSKSSFNSTLDRRTGTLVRWCCRLKEENTMRQRFLVVVLVAIFTAGMALAADSIAGNWKTVDDKTGKVESTVEIYEQGGKFFAKISGLTEPNDAQGKPKTCT